MKQHLVIPTLTLVLGIGIGVAVDRAVITTGGQGQPGKGQSLTGQIGPRAAGPQGFAGRDGSRAGGSKNFDRNAGVTIRRLSKQLEMSSTISMDYEALLGAYEAIRWMNPEEVQLALAELGSSSGMGPENTLLRYMLMGLWAKQNGKEAMEYATSLKQPMDKMMSVKSGVAGWMKHDPGNAYRWYKDNRDKLASGVMGFGMGMDSVFLASLAKQDIDTAFRELRELKGQSLSSALTMMASNVSMDEAKRTQFIDQLNKLDDKELKESGMSSMISSWARTDPQGAAGYLEGMNPKPENHETLLDSAAASWSMVDPEGALQWRLNNIGEGKVAGDVIAGSFGQWAMNDSKAAAKWLATQPEGFATDDLYSSAANNSTYVNPEGATQWAVKIEDEYKRQMSLMKILSNIQAQGEEKEKKWMDGLDPEVRQEFEDIRSNLILSNPAHRTNFKFDITPEIVTPPEVTQ